MNTNIDRIKRDIEELSKFNATPMEGLTRFSFTKEDRGAREYIKGEMIKAGLKVREDAAGTIIGRLDGELDGPVLMLGSHFDSVKNGGNFDGPAGVEMALEIARTIKDNNLKFKYPIEFIGMIEEEGARFKGGLFGSRAMVGKVLREDLDNYKDKDGISIACAMKDFGFNPDKIGDAVRKPRDVKAFIELHIEQGPVLESKGLDIGVVDYIVGIVQLEVVVKGRPDHAGTTPMTMRCDAMNTAAKVISKISDLAINEGEGTVATVGMFNILPGASNIVPGEVTFTVDIRSKNKKCIENIELKIDDALKNETQKDGTTYKTVKKLSVDPVKLSDKIIEKFNGYCDKLGYKKQTMLSGAGHDAMIMAGITEVGLIFVPSKNGRSHCPEEWTDYVDLQRGIEVVYNTVLELAEVAGN